MSKLIDDAKTVDEIDPHHRFIIYGDPGARKTTLACQAPKPIYLEVETGGSDVLHNWPNLAREVNVIPCRDRKTADKILRELQPMDHGFETVIIDTCTEFQKRLTDDVYNTVKNRHRAGEFPAEQDYLESGEIFRRMMYQYRDLPMNLVLICHGLTEKDGMEGRIITRPQVTPKMAGTLIGMVGSCYYSEVQLSKEGEVTHKLYTVSTSRFKAKNRYNLPPVIINPTWKTITERNIIHG